MIDYFAGIPRDKKALEKHRRKLALKHHPDRGGDTKIMQEINRQFTERLNGGGSIFDGIDPNDTSRFWGSGRTTSTAGPKQESKHEKRERHKQENRTYRSAASEANWFKAQFDETLRRRAKADAERKMREEEAKMHSWTCTCEECMKMYSRVAEEKRQAQAAQARAEMKAGFAKERMFTGYGPGKEAHPKNCACKLCRKKEYPGRPNQDEWRKEYEGTFTGNVGDSTRDKRKEAREQVKRMLETFGFIYDSRAAIMKLVICEEIKLDLESLYFDDPMQTLENVQEKVKDLFDRLKTQLKEQIIEKIDEILDDGLW